MPQAQSYPLDTPIEKMLVGHGAHGLTPAAAKLNKRDLIVLAGGDSTDATANLTLRDLQSISHAFAPMRQQLTGAAASTASCCCCSIFCCCCAASEPEPAMVG
jgi:hypothetical protein